MMETLEWRGHLRSRSRRAIESDRGVGSVRVRVTPCSVSGRCVGLDGDPVEKIRRNLHGIDAVGRAWETDRESAITVADNPVGLMRQIRGWVYHYLWRRRGSCPIVVIDGRRRKAR